MNSEKYVFSLCRPLLSPSESERHFVTWVVVTMPVHVGSFSLWAVVDNYIYDIILPVKAPSGWGCLTTTLRFRDPCLPFTYWTNILGWTLGKSSSQKEWLGIGMGCPESLWNHCPWRCLGKEWMWHLVPRFDKVVLGHRLDSMISKVSWVSAS